MTDANTGKPLPGASIVLLGTSLGTETDASGHFRLPGLPPGVYALSASMVGYAPRVRRGVAVAENDTLLVNLRLAPTALELPALVVSASKRARSFVDAPTSVSVVQARDLKAENTLTLDQSLNYVPGVNVIDGQVNIRGSSGYSRGTGSRVLLLIDGFPALSADNGEIKWDAVPVDQIARVEIIKGAGSALYGTGALGGIINVITRNPSPRPETRFRVLTELYGPPYYPQWKWASGPRYVESVDVSHSRQIGRMGFIVSAGQSRTNGYAQNTWYRRYRGFGKLRYAFTPTASLTATLNWARDNHGDFIQWKDRNQPLEVPIQSLGDRSLSSKLNLNLAYDHLVSARLGYRVKTYLYHTAFDNHVGGQTASDASKFGQEVQVDLQPSTPLSLTLGGEWMLDRVRASQDLFGRHTDYNLAAYAQAEYQAGERLVLSSGARFDDHRVLGRPSESQVSPKFGISWRLNPNTTFRTDLGWGFRSPSVAEIYTDATFSAIPIVPNPDLKAEHSLSWEVGVDRRFLSALKMDVSLFWSRYRNLIEARPDSAGVVSFRNVSKGHIAGLEASLQAAFGRFGVQAGYTLMNAKEDLPTGSVPLPYRPRHIASAALRATFGKAVLETRFTYRSRIQRASGLFPEGARDLIPVYLVDFSASYPVGPVDLDFTVKNAFQYNYAEVERNLGPPRRFSLGLSGKF